MLLSIKMRQTMGNAETIYNSDTDDSELKEILNLDRSSRGNRACYLFVWLSSCAISFLGGYLIKQNYSDNTNCDGSL